MDTACLETIENGKNHDDEWLPCLILLSIFSLIGAAINSFVVTVLLKLKFINQNRFLINLVIGQILLSVFVGPLHVKEIAIARDIHYCSGKTHKNYIYSLILVSKASHVVISYDRFLHVTRPHDYTTKMKGSILHFYILLPWILTVSYVFCVVIGNYVKYAFCVCITALIIFTLVINYSRLLRAMFRQYHDSALPKQTRDFRMERYKKASLLCVYILLVELICAIPGIIALVCESMMFAFGNTWYLWKSNKAIIKEIALLSLLLSVCISPFVYLYRHREFKQYCKKIFRRNRVGYASRRNLSIKRNQSVRRTTPRTLFNESRQDRCTLKPRSN